MHIDFQAQGTSILRPMIYLVNAFQTDVGSEDSVILPGDEGASFRPGEIEWHTHPRSLPEYGLNLDWQDLYNIVAGPRFVDPHHDVPDNDFRWISAIMAHYPDWHQTTGLQLYLYELAKYDGRNPLSGLSKLGPMVRVSSNR